MVSTKTTYSTTRPETGEKFTVTKGGRPIRWITWADFGDGFMHAGFSSQKEHKKAVRAPRSTNPHASRYEATAATVVEDKPAKQPQETAPTPVAEEEAPAPVVAPAEVAEVLDRIATAHADIVQHEGPIHLSDAVVHYEAHGLSWKTDDDTFGARRAELRHSGRLPHVKALAVRVCEALKAYVGDRYNNVADVTPEQIRHAARTVRLAARYSVGTAAVRLLDGDEKRRDVVLVNSVPDANGNVDAISARLNGKTIRVALADLHPMPAPLSEPEGELSRVWSVLDREGREVARVEGGETRTAAMQVVEADPVAGPVSRREGGVGLRRLRSSELSIPVGELRGLPRKAPAPRVVSAATSNGRTITVTAGFTRKSIPTRLRESGAPGGMAFSKTAGALRWVLPNGEELTPDEAAKRYLGD